MFTLHCSHALRTGIFEASKLVLINVAPTLPDIQVMVISLTVCITVVSITLQFLHLFSCFPLTLFEKLQILRNNLLFMLKY